jgi:hypothetical protein
METPVCDEPTDAVTKPEADSPRNVALKQDGIGAAKRTLWMPASPGLTTTYAETIPGSSPLKLQEEPASSA